MASQDNGRSLFLSLVAVCLHIESCMAIRVPTTCKATGPISLIDRAIPKLGHLPEGVSVVYDAKSHVHALQFLPDSKHISFPTQQLFHDCQFLPEEFSVFFILNHGREYIEEECIFSIIKNKNTFAAVKFTGGKVVFTFDDVSVEFRNFAFKDNKWHTVVFSVTDRYVAMTTDCLNKRRRRLRRRFPSFLNIDNSTTTIARCSSKDSVLKGLLKDIILVPGADVARRACPPRVPRSAFLDNNLPSPPSQETTDISSYDSVGPRWEDCTWMDVGNLAFDVYSRSIKVCVNGIWKQVSLQFAAENNKKKRLDYLEVYQDIETPSAAIDVEVFHLPGEGLFAIFANSDPRGGKRRGVSGLFKWVEKSFRLYQRLPSVSAQSWKQFTIKNHEYLAVANYGKGNGDITNSTIYRWHRHRKKFREFQSITTYTARDMEFFTIDDDHFLAIANHANENKQQANSEIFKWNKRSRHFEKFQSITTTGAYDWTYFSVEEYHFLALAQAFNGQTTLMDSIIYVYQEGSFLPFQSIETNGATDWEFFTIGENAFLVVANAYNYGAQNFRDVDTYKTNSTLYTLNRRKKAFQKYQTFVTNSAIDWEHFTIGSDHYLVVSNAQNGGTEQERTSQIYRYQGVDRFVPVHDMYLEPSSDWEVFQDEHDYYFIYANAKSKTSQVLKATFL